MDAGGPSATASWHNTSSASCSHDFFVAFSCKLRCICPFCYTKRELLWAEWAAEELLKDEIEHRLTQLRDLYAENNGIAPEDVDTTNMDAFYILQGAYVDAALEQAVVDYGSMEAYIRDGLTWLPLLAVKASKQRGSSQHDWILFLCLGHSR